MSQILLWYSKYNSNIIQLLFILIGVLLVVFIFRLFFSAKTTAAAENSETQLMSATENIENKINQILQSQSQKNMILGSAAGTSEDSAEIFEKMQAEIFNLKQTLKEKENEIAQKQTVANVAGLGATSGAVGTAMTSQTSVTEIDGYKLQIEDLKNRLSDYEVIAEDIADLHKLREENQKLVAQLGAKSTENQQAQQQTTLPDVAGLLESLTDDFVVAEKAEVSAEEKDLIEQFQKAKGS